jgi:hypothetical protein
MILWPRDGHNAVEIQLGEAIVERGASQDTL